MPDAANLYCMRVPEFVVINTRTKKREYPFGYSLFFCVGGYRYLARRCRLGTDLILWYKHRKSLDAYR